MDGSDAACIMLADEFRLVKHDGRKRLDCVVQVNEQGVTWKTVTDSQFGDSKAREQDGRITIKSLLTTTVSSNKKGGEDSVLITFHHVETRIKSRTVRTEKVTSVFSGPRDFCQKCGQLVEDLLRTESTRPKRLLVFVNPASGGSTSQKVYETKIAPLFELVGIQTDVIITKDVSHAPEVLMEYDLSSVDTVVSMGGDGTFARVCNALVLRAQKDAGIDPNDIDADLVCVPVTLAIIPAGTGNGLAAMTVYSTEAVSAALCIILGHKIAKDVNAMFSGNKFQGASVLLTAYGMFSNLIYSTERKRWMGRARYFMVLPKILSRPTSFDVVIDYLTSDGDGTWQNYTGPAVSVHTFPTIFDMSNTAICSSGDTRLSWLKPCSMRERIKYMKALFQEDESMYDLEYAGWSSVTRFKMKCVGPFTETRFGRIIDWDGEVLELPEPNFEVRVHKGLVDIIGFDNQLLPPEGTQRLTKSKREVTPSIAEEPTK